LSRRISAIEASGSGIALSWNVAPTAPLHLSLLVGRGSQAAAGLSIIVCRLGTGRVVTIPLHPVHQRAEMWGDRNGLQKADDVNLL